MALSFSGHRLLSLTVSGLAGAAPSPGTYTGCLKSGVISNVLANSNTPAGGSCSKPAVQISWKATGPTGPIGPVGPAGAAAGEVDPNPFDLTWELEVELLGGTLIDSEALQLTTRSGAGTVELLSRLLRGHIAPSATAGCLALPCQSRITLEDVFVTALAIGSPSLEDQADLTYGTIKWERQDPQGEVDDSWDVTGGTP